MAQVALGFTRYVQFQMIPAQYPEEIVSWGFHTESVDDNQDLLDTAQNWWTVIFPAEFKTRCDLSKITVSVYDAGVGHWVTETQRFFSPPILGGGGGYLPPQISIVVSQETSFIPGPLGDRSKRNRSYVGYVSAGVMGATAKLTGPGAASLLNAFLVLHSNLQLLPRFAQVGVGGLLTTSVQENTSGDTTLIRVGDVMDTQRRRRNQIPETYVSVTL